MRKTQFILIFILISIRILGQVRLEKLDNYSKVDTAVSQEAIQRIESLAPAKAMAAPAKPRKVMIFCSVTGWRPPAISLVNKTIEILGKKSGAFTVAAVSEDPSIFTPEKLAEFDAIVMNNCNELHLDEERSRALQDFVKNGKGVVGLGSSISIINWPEEAEMMGGVCYRHPFTGVPSNPKSTWALKIDDPSHPLTKMFDPRGIKIGDVMYQIVGPYSRDKMRVLLSLDVNDPRTAALAVPGSVNREFRAYRPDKDFAIAWIRDYGNGRVFFSVLTHTSGSMLFDSAMLQHFLDGIQFALGDLKVDTSPNPVPVAKPAVPVHPRKSVAEWTALLNGTDSDVRVEAILALGDLGAEANNALPTLVALLKDEAPDVRFFAASVLGRIGAAAVPGVTALLHDGKDSLRAAAAQALGRIGPDASPSAPELKALMLDKSAVVRTEAVLAISRIQKKAAVPMLVDLLSSNVTDVREAAFDALGEMGPAARAALPVITAILQGPVTAADKSNDGFYGGFYSQGPKADAMQTLTRMSELPEAKDAIIASTSLFRGDSEKGLCPALLFKVMGPNAKPAVPSLIALLQEDRGNTKGYAAQALGAIGPAAAEAIPALAGLLEDKNQFTRVSAAEAMGHLGPDAVPTLIQALQNKDWLVRAKAAQSLGALGPSAAPAAPALQEALKDNDAEVRRCATVALSRIK
jgi:HEAT repeat protein/type 1 glutamine amidotransferase